MRKCPGEPTLANNIRQKEHPMSNKEFRILIVEDNDIYRGLFKKILQSAFPEIAVDEAADGRVALYKVEAFLPDLIFMDIHLGEENGIELTKKIKATHGEIPIIILTFYDIPEYRKAALQCGSDRFIPKASLSQMEIKELVKSYQKPVRNAIY